MRWLRRIFASGIEDRKTVPVTGWNDFLDRYAMCEYGDVEPEFRPAYLVFRYQSEVFNGGHLQFFVNCDDLPMDAVSPALREVMGVDAASNFDDALENWTSLDKGPSSAPKAFAELARDNAFDRNDEFFARTVMDIGEPLVTYMTERKLLI